MEDVLSIHGLCNQGPMCLTSSEGGNTYLATFKLGMRAGVRNVENSEVRFSPLKYTNQTPFMTVTGQ